ncbi:hypothetical protein E2320_006367, partial [Naja naja]
GPRDGGSHPAQVSWLLESGSLLRDPHPMALGGGPAGLALSSFQLPRRLWRSSEAAKGCTSWGDLVEVAPCTICPGTPDSWANLLFEMLCALPGVKRHPVPQKADSRLPEYGSPAWIAVPVCLSVCLGPPFLQQERRKAISSH